MPATYATVCIDFRGTEVVELLASLVTLARVDPHATVHIMVNRECREMLDRAPVSYPETFTVVYDDRIDKYLQLTDKEINERGLVVDYYSQMFDFLRGVLAQISDDGVHYFGAGCWFLRPLDFGAHAASDFVGVGSTEDESFIGDLFFVRGSLFLDEWQEHVMKRGEAAYDDNIEDVIVKKRAEWVRIEKAKLDQEKKEKSEVSSEEPEVSPDKDDSEVSPEEEPEVPEDFDEEMRKSYRLYAMVDALKRKFAYVRGVQPEVFTLTALPDAAYINPTLFFRKDNKLEFDELKGGEGGITYKGEPVSVMRKLTGKKGAEHLNGPIHKIVSLFANDHPANQHLLTLASGQKIVFNRAYDEAFCGYKPDPYHYSELFELMEAKNQAYVTSKYLLYPCDSVGGTLQVYPGDDEAGLLLPYLSGKVHTFVHFELSDATKAAFDKFNTGGWTKQLKCPERPRLLHKVLLQTQAEQTQAEQTQAEQTQAEQTQAEQTQAEQTQAEQTQAEQTQAEQEQKDQPMPYIKDMNQREVILYEPPHKGARVCTVPNDVPKDEAEPEDVSTRRELEEAAYEAHVRSMLEARFTLVHAPHQIAEAMACGSVPIVGSSVDTEGYHFPLEEGVHYIRSEGDVERLGVGADTLMHEAGMAYYETHCSPDGFFRTLMAKYFGLA